MGERTMPDRRISRRTFAGALAASTGIAAIWRPVIAQTKMPASPVELNVVDVAGNLALTQKAIEAYGAAKPEAVSRFNFTKAPAPELPGKIKAQQDAGRVDIDLVLTGTDALSAGITQGLWTPLLPDHAKELPDLQKILQPAAWNMQSLAQGQGVVVTYYPSGPLLEYMPDAVPTPPKTAADLLAWAKANPGRFMYARPANSGPGRTLIMGLPYILGDSDPKDPEKGWEKTWAFLEELGETIEYYPTGTGATMKELGEGSRDMIASTTGWDINPRVLGTVPKEAKVAALEGFHWVSDAHYMVVPKGVSDDKLAVLLDLMNWLLQPQQQAYTFDQGYFYPGPAVQGVTLDMAPKESQDAIKEFGRPEYEQLIASHPIELPLLPDKLVIAFRMWDEQVGGQKVKK
jgi:putative spermidine/putrescine transport system substrate-binding protein